MHCSVFPAFAGILTSAVSVTQPVVLAGGLSLGSLLRGSLVQLGLFQLRESESIMHFARLGNLHCICEVRDPEQISDRRHVCRACGNEIVARDLSLLDRQFTTAEIRSMTRNLETAGIRARNLDVPESITSLDELNAWLDDSELDRRHRKPPTRPNAIAQGETLAPQELN